MAAILTFNEIKHEISVIRAAVAISVQTERARSVVVAVLVLPAIYNLPNWPLPHFERRRGRTDSKVWDGRQDPS